MPLSDYKGYDVFESATGAGGVALTNNFKRAADYLDHIGINLLRFGADASGTNDATAAIQESLDYAFDSGIKNVFAPAGTYKILLPVHVPQGVWLHGIGYSTVFFVPEGVEIGDPEDPEQARIDAIFMTDQPGVTFSRFRLIGGKLSDQPFNVMPDVRSNGIALNLGADNCMIDHVWVEKVTQHGIMVKGSYNHLSNIVSNHNIAYGVSFGDFLQGDPGSITEFCTLVNYYGEGSTAKSAIEINDGCDGIVMSNITTRNNFQHELTITDHSAGTPNTNILFNNCVLETKSLGTAVQINTNFENIHENITYQNIHVKNASTAFAIEGPCRNVRILGCSTDSATRCLARVRKLVVAGEPFGNAPENVQIANCFADADLAGGTRNIIEVTDVSGCKIAGCRLRNAGAHAILITDSDFVRIEDVDIINPGKAAGTTHGIGLVAALTKKDLKISNCRIIKTAGSSTNGINYSSNYDNAMITHNHIRGFTAAIGGDAIPGTALEESNIA